MPGYSRFRFEGALSASEATACVNRLRTFFTAIAGLMPTPVVISFSEAAQIFNDQGELIGEVAATPGAGAVATGSGNYSAPSGMVVNWLTGGFSGGRRVRGRTFIVPCTSAVYFTDGTPGTASITTLQSAAATLASGTPRLIIFQDVLRPTGRFTSSNPVTGATVPDRAAVLRSRRD